MHSMTETETVIESKISDGDPKNVELELEGTTNELYKSETSALDNFECNTSYIINYKYLSQIQATQFKEDPPYEPSLSLEWYPFCNSYYNYTEDVDFVNRVNNFLASKPSFDSLKSVQKIEDVSDEDPYSTNDSQIKFLTSNPVCFLILGKPGIGESELARYLSDDWKCCYINPKMLIEEEIEANTRVGQCIEFNLRCGRAIGVDIILRLLNKRANSQTAQHRGFVISGFPLIANELYEEDPVSSESAVFNVHEIFEEVLDATIDVGIAPQVLRHVSMASKGSKDESEIGEEEQEEQQPEEEGEDKIEDTGKIIQKPTTKPIVKDLGSASFKICVYDDIGTSYEDQIAYIFSLCKMPLLLIYISCPNGDVVERRLNNRFNVVTKEITNLQRAKAEKVVYTVFTKDPNINLNNLDNTEQEFIVTSYDNNLILPYDFPANVLTTLEIYRVQVLRHIENRALIQDPQYFIKLDGRYFPNHMFNVLRTKIGTLPIHYVVLPVDMSEAPQDLGPEDAMATFDSEMHTVEDCFYEYQNKMVISKMFKWSLSNWGYQCPVALTEGRYENGLGKYCVHFMNKLFFLSDEEAHKKFTRNPRRYLTPPYPKPNCKIFVIGPKHSGKTAVAKCLAYLLNGHYVCPKQIEADYMKRKQSEFEDMNRSLAINEALNILENRRLMQYEEMENKRLSDLQDFVFSFEDEITKYERLIAEQKLLMQETGENSSFAIEMKKQLTASEIIRQKEIEEEIKAIKLNFTKTFKLSITDDELRLKVLSNEFDISSIIPERLTRPSKLSDEVFDVHHPFVVEYVRQATDNLKMLSIEMQTNLLKEVFREALTDIETRNADLGVACGGWVVDGMPVNLDLFDSLKPDLIADDIIVLRDSIDHAFLLEQFFYKGRNDFNDYRTFFMDIGKRDAAWRSPVAVKDTDSFKIRLVQRIIDELLDTGEDGGEEEEEHEIDYRAEYFSRHPSRALIKQYEEHLHSFDASYEDFIQYIADYGKNVVEIDITNKEVPTILNEVVKIMDDKYRQEAYAQSPQDKIQEMEDFGGDQVILGEGGEDMNEEGAQTVDTFTINRRLGGTNDFCPVAFHEFNVLWKGKEELSVSFERKIYFFSSEEAMNMFIHDSNKYALKTRPKQLPPPRIAIIGVPGSGKTTMCELLRQNYGLNCFEFEDALKKTIDPTLFASYLNDEAMELPDDILSDIMLKTFTQEPFKSNGIIFSGFPRRPTDVVFMAKHGIIPDIIIELSCLQMEVYNRRMDKMISDWKIKMETDQGQQDALNRQIFVEWEEARHDRLQELVNEKREERYFNKVHTDSDKESVVTMDEKVSIDSVQDAEDMMEILRILDMEFPEPIFDDNWEVLDDAIQRFETEIGHSYELETTFNAAVREACEIEQIPWALIDANVPIKNVLNQILRVTDRIKFRNESLLERCYDVTMETAERLMQNGYHFMSRFGRTCPVQIFEEDNFIQLFNPLQGLFEIFPIIYRNYIYFLAGRKNRQKFIDNPIKYVTQTFKKFPLIPFRLAIVGPPKCGKTTLSERFQRDLGFKIISVGKAARYVLKTLSHSKLAKDMQVVLRKGWELTPEMAANCIRAMISDGKCLTQGFVLDGFPNNREESKHLAELGIIPHLILDIEAPIDDVMRCLNLDKGKNNLPRFSKKFINHRFVEYQRESVAFRKWIDKEYQNITKIHITPSKWGVWTEALQLTSAAVEEIKQYYRNAGKDMALSLSYMLVTPLEFLERQHPDFRNYCPGCQQIGKRRHGGYPPDRTGLVQFKKFFYWFCSQHLDDFRNTPDIFLPPWNNSKIDLEVPKILQLLKVPDQTYNQGCCVVCFTEHLPEKHMELGTLDYACEFYGNIYLFHTQECLDKFMLEPLVYYAKSNDVVDPVYPSLTLNSLPPMGLLEQYVAKQLVTAITNVSLKRPIIPGLSISQSALIYTGLFLKLNNPQTTSDFHKKYEEAQKLFDVKAQGLIDELEFRKKYLNPYLWYEEPLPEKLPVEEKQQSIQEDVKASIKSSDNSMMGLIDEMLDRIQYTPPCSIRTRRVPVPDERFDYLCQYFKPASKVPAFLNVVDIAGLVKGASEGQGLGNAFLSHISACDGIYHLCRVFEDDDVTHVEGDVNPVRDLEIIGEELRLKDEETLMKKISSLERNVLRASDKKMKSEYDSLMKIKDVLVDEKQHIRFHDWNTNDIEVLNKYLFLTSKPMIYLINLSEKDYIKKKNKWLLKIKEWVDKNDPGSIIIPFSGAFEFKLVEFQDADLAKRYEEDNHATSALEKIIVQGYKTLQLEYFFTSGADEVKAWTIQKGTKAPQAAGRIHTDFEKGFIMAEVMKYIDFKEEGSETAAKAAGKYRQQGRNYTVEDGDIIFFKFNAGAGLKDAKKK